MCNNLILRHLYLKIAPVKKTFCKKISKKVSTEKLILAVNLDHLVK